MSHPPPYVTKVPPATMLQVQIALHSITQAASQLDMSQPAISNALRRMREQLDDPLFVRKGNGVEPTPRAVELAGPIEEMIVTLKSALVPDETFDPQTSNRTFRVLLADPLEPVVLPSVLGAIENQSGVSIDLVSPQVGQVFAAGRKPYSSAFHR